MFSTKAGMQLAAVTVALIGSVSALAQTVVQTLDSVKVHSDTAVLNMNFDDPLEPDFTNSLINGSNYRACKHTGFGLYCLDGDLVKRTPNIANPATTFTAIDCKDPVLNLDTNKGTPCTALTVDLMGTVWLGGKNKGKSHSLFKAEPNPNPLNACLSGVGLQGNTYCATEMATGRPLLVDLSSVDGDNATTFFYGAGILGLEERKTAVFFPATGDPPIVIASGKSGWNLIGNEQLISAAAIQVEDAAENPFSYVLATTTKDRVLAKRADGSGAAVPVFDIPANRGPAPPALCPPGDAHYGIRSSGKTGTVYLTDKQYCTVTALQVNAQPDGSLVENSLDVIDTLSTIDTVGSEGTHAPIAPTVSPGIGVDLDDCSFDPSGNPIICTLVVDAQGDPAATLSGVNLASAESGLTLYQVKNIPDCRYDPQTCVDLLDDVSTIPDLFPDVIWDPDGTGDPAAQLLNVTELLPNEVTDQFLLSGGLPDMWLARQYRGQKSNGFVFEAFFGVTEDGVIFRDTFEGVFNVGALAGSSLGCVPIIPGSLSLPTDLTTLLAWDVLNTVSEEFLTFDDPFLPGGAERVSTIINSGCGSSQSIDVRWSLKPYNLEITPCTYNPNSNDVWASDGSCPVDPTDPGGLTETIDDAVFAKLLLSLFDDFKLALDQLACMDADGAGSPPIADCSTLVANWVNAKDKLDKCWDATQQPKQSAGAQNCTAFVSQLNGLEAAVNAVVAPLPPLDPANRIGELKSRLGVIRHVRLDRFTPSIPADGFVEPQP